MICAACMNPLIGALRTSAIPCGRPGTSANDPGTTSVLPFRTSRVYSPPGTIQVITATSTTTA